jgi:hypothetical protein
VENEDGGAGMSVTEMNDAFYVMGFPHGTGYWRIDLKDEVRLAVIRGGFFTSNVNLV